jgi:cysteine desulfurase
MTELNSKRTWVYLDNNATTKTDPRVVEAMLPFLCEHFANPSALHGMGLTAADAVRVARGQIAALIGSSRDSEIVFTSGGSESNNTAILSALQTQEGRNEIITSIVEHPAVLALCAHLEKTGKAKVHRIPVDHRGALNLDAYRNALSANTALVSIQWANNETGVVFPIEMLTSMAHRFGALFHSDGVQAAGRVPLNVEAAGIDMLSISAHKIHGPKGIGALYVRHGQKLIPLIHGGRQERGRRAGTENTPAIAGFGVAAEIAALSVTIDMPRISRLKDHLEQEILRQIPSAMRVGDAEHCLPNTLNIAFDGVEADSILAMLDRASIAVSSGSACTSGSMLPSHVLVAMKIPFSHLRGSIRFSLSRENTRCDIDGVLAVLPQVINDLHCSSMTMEASYA